MSHANWFYKLFLHVRKKELQQANGFTNSK